MPFEGQDIPAMNCYQELPDLYLPTTSNNRLKAQLMEQGVSKEVALSTLLSTQRDLIKATLAAFDQTIGVPSSGLLPCPADPTEYLVPSCPSLSAWEPLSSAPMHSSFAEMNLAELDCATHDIMAYPEPTTASPSHSSYAVYSSDDTTNPLRGASPFPAPISPRTDEYSDSAPSAWGHSTATYFQAVPAHDLVPAYPEALPAYAEPLECVAKPGRSSFELNNGLCCPDSPSHAEDDYCAEARMDTTAGAVQARLLFRANLLDHCRQCSEPEGQCPWYGTFCDMLRPMCAHAQECQDSACNNVACKMLASCRSVLPAASSESESEQTDMDRIGSNGSVTSVTYDNMSVLGAAASRTQRWKSDWKVLRGELQSENAEYDMRSQSPRNGCLGKRTNSISSVSRGYDAEVPRSPRGLKRSRSGRGSMSSGDASPRSSTGYDTQEDSCSPVRWIKIQPVKNAVPTAKSGSKAAAKAAANKAKLLLI